MQAEAFSHELRLHQAKHARLDHVVSCQRQARVQENDRTENLPVHEQATKDKWRQICITREIKQ